MRSKILLGLYS